VSLIPSLMLKTDFKVGIGEDQLAHLTTASRLLDERLNRAPAPSAAYVGDNAFAHKGGLHVSAVEKDPRTYEHVDPGCVGNKRHIVVSDQAGRSNIVARFRELGLDSHADEKKIGALVERVKAREFEGYAYDGAEASFELLARRALGEVPDYFSLRRFRVMDDRRWNARDELVTESEATVTVAVAGRDYMTVANGNGPINALDNALRKSLLPLYPRLEGMRLVDYKVRILTPQAGTGAVTRVMIENADDDGRRWTTVGVSSNIIDASTTRFTMRSSGSCCRNRQRCRERQPEGRAVLRHRSRLRRPPSGCRSWPAPIGAVARCSAGRWSCSSSRSWRKTSAWWHAPC
jgi:2-isopropylmalate synthase